MKIIFLVVFIGLLVFFSFKSSEILGITPPTHTTLLDMSSFGKNVYIVYENNGSYFIMSSNGGLDFTKPHLMNYPNATWIGLSKIAIEKNKIYIAWEGKAANSTNSSVSLRRSMDGGNTFEAPIITSNNGTNSTLLQLMASNNHVYIVMSYKYLSYGKSYDDISFRASSDNGTTFGKNVDLLPHAMESTVTLPPVDTITSQDGKNVYVIGMYTSNDTNPLGDKNQIFFEKSEDFGNTFSLPMTIYSTNQEIKELHSAVSGDNLYLSWAESTSPDVNFMKSSDGGNIFDPSVILTKNFTVGRIVYPSDISVSANQSMVYVLWKYISAETDNPPALYLAKSNDIGSTFSIPINITGSCKCSTFDAKTLNSSLYLAMVDDNPDSSMDILFKKSPDNGTSFSKALNLSGNLGDPSNPLLDVSGDKVYVGWSSSDNDLHFMSSYDGGKTFTPTTVSNLPEFPLSTLMLSASIFASILVYTIWQKKKLVF